MATQATAQFIDPKQTAPHEEPLDRAPQVSAHARLENDAIYFSRRAREERQASARGDCRKCRQVHLELAQAYEFRAHLITREIRSRFADELFAL